MIRLRNRMAQRKSALIAGTSLFIMAIAAIFTYGIVHQSIQVQGNEAETLQNIVSHRLLIHAEIAGWILILLCDIIAAWSLYLFLQPAHRRLSLLSSWLRLAYAAMLGVAVTHLIRMQLTAPSQADLLPLTQLQPQALLHLKAFDFIWSAGLIVFGGHLLVLGMLASLSQTVPKWISLLLIAASVGYIVVHALKIMMPEHPDTALILERIFLAPMTAGELSFCLWLLFKGGKAAS